MKKFFQDFKKFITRGNVVDMAVGVVVGSAFTAIVNSLVKDIITPVIGVCTGGVDFTDKQWVLKSHLDADGVEVIDNAIRYGNFIQMIINFLIIAFVIFVVIRLIAKAGEKKRLEEEAAAAAKKAADDAAAAAKKAEEDKIAAEKAAAEAALRQEELALLREIRDSLKK